MDSFILERSELQLRLKVLICVSGILGLKVVVPECVGLSPLVLPLLGLIVAEAALGCGLWLRHGGHISVHIVHPSPDLLHI